MRLRLARYDEWLRRSEMTRSTRRPGIPIDERGGSRWIASTGRCQENPRMALIAPLRARLLRPRLAPDALGRPRLIARLAEGLERPLTLVCAPAGYGKTTLLRQWLDACTYPAAWLSLDALDGDPASLLAALVGA